MKELDSLMKRFEAACRRGHQYMTEDRWGPGMNRFDKMSGLAKEILKFGKEGAERLFSLAEGDDLLLAIHAANYLYAVDPRRCERALIRIMKVDRGFFGHGARIQLETQKYGIDWMIKKYMCQLPEKKQQRRFFS
jgi:hypothetical protein